MEQSRVIALAGNPNVGKSTVFNQLTGLHQHTGNWPGKTVSNARGSFQYGETQYTLVDVPGSYSLNAHSAEEEVARDFLCFGGPDAVVVVCDATCLERNLNLVLQVMEVAPYVVVCINLMDEAGKKQITIDLEKLQRLLCAPVVGTAARSRQGIQKLCEKLNQLPEGGRIRGGLHPVKKSMKTMELAADARVCCNRCSHHPVEYPQMAERLIQKLLPTVRKWNPLANSRWVSARLLEDNQDLLTAMGQYWGQDPRENKKVAEMLGKIHKQMRAFDISQNSLSDAIRSAFVKKAEQICSETVTFGDREYGRRDRRLDRLFTSRATGFPIMFLILLGIFWLTIKGANIPSQMLSSGLFWLESRLFQLLGAAGMPGILNELLVHGIYRTVSWVVSVMLPPMAIFFPLFTLLEDFGYLPRVAFNLDHCFKKCRACGKQALTTCMGFGCNAAAVMGCRIIDSPRERLIAILTNNFVPCNGRFPLLISLLSMFFLVGNRGWGSSLVSAALLAALITAGVGMTLLVSRLLSATVLKGVPSSFTLELPPYRRPQIGKTLVRSIFDRTLFVLGRAVTVAAPAGLVIWLMANFQPGGQSLLAVCSGCLDPFARALGMDGVILTAFLLGLPANEIVLPIILMGYLSQGSLTEIQNLSVLRELFVDQGWTWVTALCTMLFSIMHWPCSTTCLTIRRETGSWKWTAAAFLIPTAAGILVCFLVRLIF